MLHLCSVEEEHLVTTDTLMVHYHRIIKANSRKRHYRAAQRAERDTTENVLLLQIAVRWLWTKGRGAAERSVFSSKHKNASVRQRSCADTWRDNSRIK